MKDMVTPVPPEEVKGVIRKCLEQAAQLNYQRIKEYAKIEGNPTHSLNVSRAKAGLENVGAPVVVMCAVKQETLLPPGVLPPLPTLIWGEGANSLGMWPICACIPNDRRRSQIRVTVTLCLSVK